MKPSLSLTDTLLGLEAAFCFRTILSVAFGG